MVSPTGVASAGIGFSGVLSFLMIFIIIASVVATGVVESIKQRDITPLLSDLGNKFLLTSQSLAENSNKIINNEVSWKNYAIILGFISSLLIMFLWFKILAFLIGNSWFSNKDNSFTNYSLAVIIYVILQIIVLLVNANLTGSVTCISGCETSASKLIMTPILSLVLPISALYHMLQAFSGVSSKLNEIANKTLS